MRKFLLLALLVLSQTLGDIWLSRGMKQFGEVNAINPSVLLQLIVHSLTNPWIWLGIAFLVSSLFFYLTAISRFELSYVLPILASSYVLNALLAWSILDEKIAPIRWASTILIAFGVSLVGWNESRLSKKKGADQYPTRTQSKFKKESFVWLFLAFGFYVSRTWLAIILIALADSIGDVFLAMGMKQVGKVEILPAPKMLKLVRRLATNHAIIIGIFCQALAFFSFISVLAWADISFVRPATALTYILSILGARYILKEQITTGRFRGIIIIGIGILLHR